MKLERLTTPIGKAVWPYLNNPDTKFDEDGVYKVTLRLDQDDEATSQLVSSLQGQADQWYKSMVKEKGNPKLKKADLPWSEVIDEDGNPTGEIDIRFKLKAKIRTKDDRVIENNVALFDAEGTPFKSEDIIGSGSKLKVCADAWGYMAPIGCGVTLRIVAVQVLDLKTYEGKSAQDFGFDKTEGFTAPPKEDKVGVSEEGVEMPAVDGGDF